MTGVAVASVALLTVALSANPARPTQGALQRAAQDAQRTLVEVVGPKRVGPGIVVSAQGHVLTAVEYVRLESARLRRGAQEQDVPVTYADAKLGLALALWTPGGPAPGASDSASGPPAGAPATETRAAVAVRLEPPKKGEFLIALGRGKGGVVRPKVAKVMGGKGRHKILDLVLPPGTPLVDTKGRLVAVAVRGGRAVPISELKQALASTQAAAP